MTEEEQRHCETEPRARERRAGKASCWSFDRLDGGRNVASSNSCTSSASEFQGDGLSKLASTLFWSPFAVIMPARILAYSATAGYRHDSIEPSIEALKAKASSINVEFDFTEDKNRFTDENLARYDAILFLNNSGISASHA